MGYTARMAVEHRGRWRTSCARRSAGSSGACAPSRGSARRPADRARPARPRGPASISDLAAAEQMRPQSMAQTVRDLEDAGLVSRRPDPDDGRRAIVELTARGRERVRADPRAAARAG